MKSVIAAVLTCVVLFAASLGATQYLFKSETDDELAEASTAMDADSAPETPPTGEEIQQMVQMPVAFKPDPSVSVESVMQMSDSIKATEQQLILREQELEKRKQQVDLLFEDLATEEEELQAFREGIDAKMQMLNEMTVTFRNTLDELEAKRIEIDTLKKENGSDDESKQEAFDERVKIVSTWFEGLEAQQASDYLKEFANKGDIEFAASLLQRLSDRQKTKILAAMSDPVLVSQLIESLGIEVDKK